MKGITREQPKDRLALKKSPLKTWYTTRRNLDALQHICWSVNLYFVPLDKLLYKQLHKEQILYTAYSDKNKYCGFFSVGKDIMWNNVPVGTNDIHILWRNSIWSQMD